MTLFQPQLAGRQQEVRLASEQAYWARAGGADRVLIEFPLPGATSGRPMYLLYLRLLDAPAIQETVPGAGEQQTEKEPLASAGGGTGPLAAANGDSARERDADTERAREPETVVSGFLIQTRGEYAGRALVIGGGAVFQQPPRQGARRQLDLDLALEEGSRISGSLPVRWDESRLSFFETHRYSADVAAVAIEN